MSDPADRRRAFRQLHQSGCFVIPNPWDVGSAKLLAQLGFKALASTSSGLAWSLGRQDNHATLDQVLVHLRALASAVDVPVSADFEGAFAVEPEEVEVNVASALTTGIAGLSVEDSKKGGARGLLDFDLSVERVRAARAAFVRSGDSVLTARSEGFVAGQPDLRETIRRLVAYAEAGADCLFAPGIRDKNDIATVVKAVAPKPVNVLVSSDFTNVTDLTQLGVRRISVGGALARAAWSGFLAAAKEIAEKGTFTQIARAIPGAELDGRFA